MSADAVPHAIGGTGSRRGEARRVVVEALVIGGLGVGFALLANHGSPNGLDLTRNYFPPASPAATVGAAASDGSGELAEGRPDSNGGRAGGGLEARLRQRGLESVERGQMQEWFEDPRYLSEGIVFIDARREGAYQAGHIPGSYLFDHYRPDPYLPEVLPACQFAEIVVVYCSGGECEDSVFAAELLRGMGVPGERLRVYPGGIDDWSAHGLPVETGPRHSGELRPRTPGP